MSIMHSMLKMQAEFIRAGFKIFVSCNDDQTRIMITGSSHLRAYIPRSYDGFPVEFIDKIFEEIIDIDEAIAI